MFVTKKTFKKLQEQYNELSNQVEVFQQAVSLIQNKINEYDPILITLQENYVKLNEITTRLNIIENRKNSNQPWFDIGSADFDADQGIKMQLDWNDAFIDFLKQNGYVGMTETDLVSQYLNDWLRTITPQTELSE